MEQKDKRQDAQNNAQIVSLTSLPEGAKGVVAHAIGGYGLIRRLAEMGLTPGVEVKLTKKCPFRGPVEVEVRGVALALGYGVASKIFVKPLRKEPNG
ncbi:MAG: FeoA family protein [Candidatus Bathyarchaeales archaeon]